jgi:hypothetical protein
MRGLYGQLIIVVFIAQSNLALSGEMFNQIQVLSNRTIHEYELMIKAKISNQQLYKAKKVLFQSEM